MVNTHQSWLQQLRRLNPNKSRRKGYAPHKPCLLLTLLDMAQDGELASRELNRTPGMRVRFNAFTQIALDRWGGNIQLEYPFYHLKTQGFWDPLQADGSPSPAVHTTRIIRLDSDFFDCIQDPGFRRSARIVLADTWFPPAERVALYTLLGVRTQTKEFQNLKRHVAEDAAKYGRQKGRDARFRVQVVCRYHHTCALTGYRILTDDGASLVEAAHIEPFATSRNDDIHNGLALSRNAHWSFDLGLWSVDDQSRILVNRRRFQEWGPSALQLASLGGNILQFDPKADLRPEMTYFDKHRNKHGFN